jgi:S-methylmethionine-dependent homocysteine/selenocysteine methylase
LERLLAGPYVLLDGATGTELERRGYRTSLPLWTADAALAAPDLLRRIHCDYLEAGADIVTANTFRTTPYTLRRHGRENEAAALTARTVQVAREACREVGRGLVAGCVAPLEDCYDPARVPPPDVARREHAAHVRNLVAAGVDLLLVETMGTAREAHAAAEAALASGVPVLVSFILDPHDGGALLSGEDLEAAAAHLLGLEVDARRIAALLVNCAPLGATLLALERLAGQTERVAIGAYANLGWPDAERGWEPDPEATPARFGAWARDCRALGARIVGGCCGTTPEHVDAAARALGRD